MTLMDQLMQMTELTVFAEPGRCWKIVEIVEEELHISNTMGELGIDVWIFGRCLRGIPPAQRGSYSDG